MNDQLPLRRKGTAGRRMTAGAPRLMMTRDGYIITAQAACMPVDRGNEGRHGQSIGICGIRRSNLPSAAVFPIYLGPSALSHLASPDPQWCAI